MAETVKHTKGPWVVDYTTGEILAADRRVASTQSGGIFNLYDARLIAAAPDLLEALRQMTANSTLDGKEYRDCHKKALEAILKAGEL